MGQDARSDRLSAVIHSVNTVAAMKAKETDLMMTSVQMTKSRKPTHHSTANSGKDKEVSSTNTDNELLHNYLRTSHTSNCTKSKISASH